MNIHDPEVLFELALACAERPFGLTPDLHHFGITNQDHLKTIIDILAPYITKYCPITQYGHHSYDFVFKLMHREVLVETDTYKKWDAIAHIIKQPDLDFGIFQQSDSCNLLMLAMSLFKIHEANGFDNLAKPVIRNAILEWGQSIGLKLDDICLELETKKKIIGNSVFRESLEDNITKENYSWLLSSIADFATNPGWVQDPDFKQKKSLFLKTLEKCALIHNPGLRKDLVDNAFKTFSNPAAWDFYKAQRKAKSNEYFFIPQLVAASLISKNVSLSTIDGVLQNIYALGTDIKDRKINEAFYRFVNYCHTEMANGKLKPHHITRLFFIIFEPIAFKARPNKYVITQRLGLLRNIGELGDITKIIGQELAIHSNDLQKLFLKIFQKSVPVRDREDFASRYEAVFVNSRFPTTILIYAAALNALDDEATRKKSLDALAVFIDNVLDGVEVFKERRMSTENNPHLATIFATQPELQAL